MRWWRWSYALLAGSACCPVHRHSLGEKGTGGRQALIPTPTNTTAIFMIAGRQCISTPKRRRTYEGRITLTQNKASQNPAQSVCDSVALFTLTCTTPIQPHCQSIHRSRLERIFTLGQRHRLCVLCPSTGPHPHPQSGSPPSATCTAQFDPFLGAWLKPHGFLLRIIVRRHPDRQSYHNDKSDNLEDPIVSRTAVAQDSRTVVATPHIVLRR